MRPLIICFLLSIASQELVMGNGELRFTDSLLNKYSFRLQFKITGYDSSYFNPRSSCSIATLSKGDNTLRIHHEEGFWKIETSLDKTSDIQEIYDLKVKFILEKGEARQCLPSVDMIFGNWNQSNYLLMPGSAYNGNRYESRKIAYSPKLNDHRDIGKEKRMIVADIPRLNISNGPSFIHARSGDMSVPSAGFYSPGKNCGFWMLTKQGGPLGDYGISFTENRQRDKAVLNLSPSVVRELYKYRICDNNFPSDDKVPDFHVGDSVILEARLYFFPATAIQDIYDKFSIIRQDLTGRVLPAPSIPLSACFRLQQEKFNKYNFVEPLNYYAVGMRENFLQDWQIGWTGGMISTYPLLFNGDSLSRDRVLQTFDWLFPAGISPSGFFWDSGESSNDSMHWYGGDIRRPHTSNWHLVRKSGDGLYFVLKQLMLMDKMGIKASKSWKEGAQTVSDAFVRLWKNNGQLGQFVDSRNGEIQVGGSTSGAIVPAALVLASGYFNNPAYQKIAEEIAEYYYQNFVRMGITCGGPGDALQSPDSESSYAMLESFIRLYETSRDKKWLKYAEEMSNQFSSWVIGYNYSFPEHSALGRSGILTTGAVMANAQNKHGAPGICTHSGSALLRLYRESGDKRHLDILQEITRFIPQNLSHPQHPIPGMKNGWMSERVSTTDWLEGIGEIMYGSTWAETALMLTYTEIPGIYVFPERSVLVAFDQLEAVISGDTKREIEITLTNTWSESALFRLYVDSEEKLNSPLEENYLYNCQTLILAPNETKTLKFKK